MSKPGRRAHRQNRIRSDFETYLNRQPARALAVILGIPMLVCLLAAMSRSAHGLSLWLLSTGFLLVFMLFSSLTITVGRQALAWHFGPGLIRKEVPLSGIAAARIVRTRLLDGIGIHYTRNGWLYSVSGRDAVVVTMKDGKQFALGTNDPVGLWEAIEKRLPPSSSTEA
ncbi:hypothetical protein ACFONG_07690 [Uliginosibacterium paludis]|uniref:PH domain-containing protein n=1 Tax=Uliginosibacterium paludis TaxID=1615952 RepID=A0ABV2CKW4_9RHOO